MKLGAAILIFNAAFSGIGSAKERENSESYRWVVEQGHAVGCLKQSGFAAPEAGCAKAATFNLECAKVISRDPITDLEECRRHLPVRTAWAKGASFLDCVATTEGGAGKTIAIVAHLAPAECGHNTIVLDDGCQFVAGGNLSFHPSSKFSAEDLAPEILNLAQGATIPPEVYAKYDSRRLGLSIVQKIHREVETDNSGAGEVDFLNASAVQLAFHEEDIDRIAKNGFLNQHQVGKSGASLDPEHRVQKEDQFLGYRLNDSGAGTAAVAANEVRPKYAYFATPGAPLEKDPMFRSDKAFISPNYGNIFAVFNPEVKDRTTFTMMDSLGVNNRTDVRTLRYHSTGPADPTAKAGTYMEAQIWGALAMNDVKQFIVNCPGSPPISPEALTKLKGVGKPIYECRVDKRYPEAEVAAKPGLLGFFAAPARKLSAEEREKAGVVVRVREGDMLFPGK